MDKRSQYILAGMILVAIGIVLIGISSYTTAKPLSVVGCLVAIFGGRFFGMARELRNK